MTDEELRKYLHWMNKEYGQRGYSAGKGPPDMYGRQTTTGKEGWSDLLRDQLKYNQYGDNMPSGMGLLDNREDIEQALGHRLVDAEAPPLKQVPLMKDMLNTSGVPYWDDPETAGTRIPFPSTGNNELRNQINALYDQGQSNYYGPPGFQNRIRPLPHQLEGPETAIGPMMAGGPPDMYGRQMAHRGSAYDPNQELYNPNYYGTAGQMGQMGAPPPGIIPSSVTGRHISPNAPYSVTGRAAMSGGEMPGLLNSGGEYVSQALPPGQSTTEQDWQKQAWDKKSGSPGSKKGSGWMADDRMRNAQLGQLLLNFGEQSRSDDGWGGSLTHY